MPGAQECKIQASRVPPTADAPSPLRLRRPTPLVASSVPHAARRQVRCGAGCHCASAQQPSTSRPLLAYSPRSKQPARHATPLPTPPVLHPRRRPGSTESRRSYPAARDDGTHWGSSFRYEREGQDQDQERSSSSRAAAATIRGS
jgi:hypothetical protein